MFSEIFPNRRKILDKWNFQPVEVKFSPSHPGDILTVVLSANKRTRSQHVTSFQPIRAEYLARQVEEKYEAENVIHGPLVTTDIFIMQSLTLLIVRWETNSQSQLAACRGTISYNLTYLERKQERNILCQCQKMIKIENSSSFINHEL